jgi:hypothetical protein
MFTWFARKRLTPLQIKLRAAANTPEALARSSEAGKRGAAKAALNRALRAQKMPRPGWCGRLA